MGSRRNLTQKQCVWHCTGCSTLRAMETRLPSANSWSAKDPIQFDEVIVFSTIWVHVRACWFLICTWSFVTGSHLGLGGYIQTSSLGGYICYFIDQRGSRSYGGGNLI